MPLIGKDSVERVDRDCFRLRETKETWQANIILGPSLKLHPKFFQWKKATCYKEYFWEILNVDFILDNIVSLLYFVFI